MGHVTAPIQGPSPGAGAPLALMNGRTQYPQWPNRSAKPTVSWSAESAHAECPRRWLNEYHNELLPPKLGKQIRVEKPLLSGAMLAGRVVDDVLDGAFRRYQETGDPPEVQLNDVRAACRARFQDYFRFSGTYTAAALAGKTLPEVPGLAPLEAILFGETVPPEEGRRLLDKAERCVTGLLRSPLYARLRALPPAAFVPKPRGRLADGAKVAIPWYWADRNPVYASYDLLVFTPGEEIEATVIDWKTGNRERGEGRTERQLNYYAPFVTTEYGVPPERIELMAVWLADGAETSTFEPDPAFLDKQVPRWEAWRADLRGRTLDVKDEPDRLEELFPLVADPLRCRFCKYRSCPGYARLAALPGVTGSVLTGDEPSDPDSD